MFAQRDVDPFAACSSCNEFEASCACHPLSRSWSPSTARARRTRPVTQSAGGRSWSPQWPGSPQWPQASTPPENRSKPQLWTPGSSTPPEKRVAAVAPPPPPPIHALWGAAQQPVGGWASQPVSIVSAACQLLESIIVNCPVVTVSKVRAAAALPPPHPPPPRARRAYAFRHKKLTARLLPPPQSAYGAIYHSVSVPDISATQYLTSHLLARGLMRKEHLADTTVLHAMLLIDRLMRMQSHNGFHLCKSNVHRVLLSVLLLSAKLLDDETYNNEWWASVGGVTNAHLNELEWYTLSSMDFRLSVTADELDGVRAKLVGRRC